MTARFETLIPVVSLILAASACDGHGSRQGKTSTQPELADAGTNTAVRSGFDPSSAFEVVNVPATNGNRTDEEPVLKQKVSDLQSRVSELTLRVANLESQIESKGSVQLDLLGKGFQALESGFGPLLLSCEGAEPYLNGHKLKLEIGNPLNAMISGFKVKCTYGLKMDFASITNYLAHVKSLRTNEVAFTENLKPGVWNPVELILVPSKVEELGYLQLSIVPQTVNLTTVPKN